MVRNALFAAAILFCAFAAFVLSECEFLSPYRAVLWRTYGTEVIVFSSALFFNLFALVYALGRKIALKDTGQKLAHLEKQLRSRETVSEELSRRIEDLEEDDERP